MKRLLILLLPVLAFGQHVAQKYTVVDSITYSGPLTITGKINGEAPWTYVICTADSSSASRDVTAQNKKIPSLDITLAANTTYEVEYTHYYTSGQAATGIAITPVASGSVTSLVGYTQVPGSAADGTDNLVSGSHLASADTVVATLTAVLNVLVQGKTYLTVVNGASERTLSLYIKSEVTGQTVTYKTGSWARYRKALATTW